MNIALILAAGKGERMEKHQLPKAFIDVLGKPLFYYSLSTFQNSEKIDRIVLVVPKDFLKLAHEYQINFNFPKLTQIVVGGETRQQSVYFALQNLNASPKDIILIHDAARPLVNERIIAENIEVSEKIGAAATILQTSDTIVVSKNRKLIDSIPKREEYYLEQTPASFRFDIIYKAHQCAFIDGISDSSDDLQLVARLGGKIGIIDGDKDNFKVTSEADLNHLLAIISK